MGERRTFLLGSVIAAMVVLFVLRFAVASSPVAALTAHHALRLQVPSTTPAPSPQPTPHSIGEMDPTQRLAHPSMSNPPTQIELGHHEYWMSCMVCHGDQGQGLTEEWRDVLDPEDQNCWQAKCHGASHPPYGFQIPRQSPLVMGTGALTGYKTAADLFEFLRVRMPWSYPGLFEDQDYWQLTAFLADANEVDLGQRPLGPDNADEILLLPQLVQTHHPGVQGERIAAGVMGGLLLGAAILYRWIRAL